MSNTSNRRGGEGEEPFSDEAMQRVPPEDEEGIQVSLQLLFERGESRGYGSGATSGPPVEARGGGEVALGVQVGVGLCSKGVGDRSSPGDPQASDESNGWASCLIDHSSACSCGEQFSVVINIFPP